MIRFIVLFAFFVQTFAHQRDDCESRLDLPLVRLVMAANTQGQLGLAEIEALAQSPVPYNPLSHVTNTAKNTALKRVLEENVRTLPKSKWPNVQKELRAFAAELRQKRGQSVDAKKKTFDLFLPDVIREFRKGSPSNDNAFVYTDEHGHMISVFIAGKVSGMNGSNEAYLETTDLTARTSTERTYIGNLYATKFSAYVTPDKRIRIAFQATVNELKIIALPDVEHTQVYRFASLSPTPDPVRPDLSDTTPSNFLITKDGRRLIAATNHHSIQVFDLDKPQAPLFTFASNSKAPALELFETSSGKILLMFKNSCELSVIEIDGAQNKTAFNLKLPTMISSMSIHEAGDGTVFVSTMSPSHYRVYTPLTGNETPYFEAETFPAPRDENFWFRDRNGRDLNYVMSSIQGGGSDMIRQIAVFDPANKRKIFNRESKSFYTGSPAVLGPGGDPRLVVVGGPRDPSLVSVIDPLHEGVPTQELKLSQPIDPTGFQGMIKFIDPKGEEALLVNGKNKGSVLRLRNPPTVR